MKTILEIIELTEAFLQKCKIDRAKREAEDLIASALNMKRLDLYLKYDQPLTENELEVCRQALQRRGKREPLEYIFGNITFYGLNLFINKDVLIPRKETEILVDLVAGQLTKMDLKGKVLWDICTGSGCIGLALKKVYPELRVILSDLSPKAIEVAKLNAEKNGLSVEFRVGDLLSPFAKEACDILLCNPPYITEAEFLHLEPEVALYEPKEALVSGENGLEFYQRLAKEIFNRLTPGALAWFEIGTGQGEVIKKIFNSISGVSSGFKKDWAGHDRFFFLEKEALIEVS